MNINMLTASLVAAALLAGCQEVERRTELRGALVGVTRTAGPGDTVMEFKATKPLPNIAGKADIFGRTTDAAPACATSARGADRRCSSAAT